MSGVASARTARARAGVLLTWCLLLGVACCLLTLHDDPWWIAAPRPARWIEAAGATLAFVALCLWTLRRHRQRAADPAAANADAVLVAWASQTGFARELAQRTTRSLVDAGCAARMVDVASVDAGALARGGRVLFVASTTGEGDPPDHAFAFVRDVLDGDAAFAHLHYAVLALGDRSYARYCGFGHRIDLRLRTAGATPMFDLVEVDNGDDGALRHWQHHLGLLAGAPELPDWTPARYDDWTLHARRLLNPGSVGGAAFHLELAPPAGSTPAWRAGDIAEIGPCNAPHDVAAFLAAIGQDASVRVEHGDRPTALGDVLSRARLPDAETVRATAPQALVDRLVALPHREYSIASLPADGRVHLLVRRMRRADGRAGLGSGWLCAHAPIGSTIALRIRANPNFHPPADDRPLILIGNGTGIAGLRAQLKHRAAQGATRNWLLFGERNAATDAFYAHDIEAWREAGVLPRVDLAYSRDQRPASPERTAAPAAASTRYVQHVLREADDHLRAWIADGAAIYVCGSLHGMAPGVDRVLREVLGDAEVERLMAEGRYRRDVY